MKIQTLALLAALGGLSGAAGAASPIRTNYEVTLQNDGGTATSAASKRGDTHEP